MIVNPNGGDSPEFNQSNYFFGKGTSEIGQIGKQFKAIVASIMRLCASAAESDLLALIEQAYVMVAAKRIRLLTSHRTEEMRRAQVRSDAAKALDRQCDTGVIPQHLDESFSLPPTAWEKLGFGFLLALGVLLSLCEAPNLAWYLRFTTDSFWIALLYCLPVSSLAFIEIAILQKRDLISERVRKKAICVQAVFGALFACGYLYMCLHHADAASTFSPGNQILSQDSLRMGLQLLTSITFSGILMHCALSMGHGRRANNPRFSVARNEAELHRRAASLHYDEASDINGELEQLAALKDAELVSCQIKSSQVRMERERHNQNLKRILNQEQEL